MDYFSKYTSNTTAGSANQLFFSPISAVEPLTGRVYYRVFASGTYNYSFLFSNVLDSTFDHGDVAKRNRIIDTWNLHETRVAVTKTCDPYALNTKDMQQITFGGGPRKQVAPGEFFTSDPIELCAESGDYVCVEYVFSGREIPYHEERIIPAYVMQDGKWFDSARVPFLGMLGCDRPVKRRIVFWGDSITQGIGTERNSYDHWNARLAELLGDDYSYWNLGIGFGRASDASSLGAWFYKAKHADLAVVCFGVNDLLQTGDDAQIKRDLSEIVEALTRAGVRIILQTVPPFNYQGDLIEKWKGVNEYIKTVLAPRVEAVFDNGTVLSLSASEPQTARFGGHPDAEGCRLWAEALLPVMREVLNRFKEKDNKSTEELL